MKTERRHELQTNQLADSLGHWLDAVKPYGQLMAWVGVGALVLIAGMAYWSNQEQKKQAVGWTELFKFVDEAASARDATQVNDAVSKLDEFKTEYAGTPVDYWSRLTAADFRLSAGASELFKDKAEAQDLLKAAEGNYEFVAKNARDPMLQQRAYFGLARTQESLGELKAASETYKTLLQKWKDGPYAAAADKRVTDLEQEQTKEFYDWFAKYQPPKQPAAGERPIFDHDSLMSPGGPSGGSDIKLPSVVDLLDSAPKSPTPPATTDGPAPLTPPATPEEPKKTDEPAKTEEPKKEAAPATTPEAKTESPAPEAKPEAPKTEAPKADAPKAEEAPKADAPKEPELKLPEAK